MQNLLLEDHADDHQRRNNRQYNKGIGDIGGKHEYRHNHNQEDGPEKVHNVP
jgi:hypothetical protein